MHSKFLSVAGFCLLAACSGGKPDQSAVVQPSETSAAIPSASPSTPAVAYTCDKGRTLSVSYDNSNPESAKATLSFDGKSFNFTSTQAASGARYESATGLKDGYKLIWWTADDEGTLFEAKRDAPANGDADTEVAQCKEAPRAG